mmetsp:Transcript_43121/g.84729  ORF Transcript_43121/g.84729 Transcript_43121/m.84729 type:complete len:298 (-) Transcript_43121:199-1092(-)
MHSYALIAGDEHANSILVDKEVYVLLNCLPVEFGQCHRFDNTGAKPLDELALPVFDQTAGADDHHPLGRWLSICRYSRFEQRHDERDALEGFSQAHVVGEDASLEVSLLLHDALVHEGGALALVRPQPAAAEVGDELGSFAVGGGGSGDGPGHFRKYAVLVGLHGRAANPRKAHEFPFIRPVGDARPEPQRLPHLGRLQLPVVRVAVTPVVVAPLRRPQAQHGHHELPLPAQQLVHAEPALYAQAGYFKGLLRALAVGPAFRHGTLELLHAQGADRYGHGPDQRHATAADADWVSCT